MATTTRKSSKAKTKIIKKTVRRAQVKSATKSAKIIKKSTAVKAVKVTPAKNATSATAFEQLRQQNIFAAFISLGLAGVAGYFMGSHSVQLFTSLLTKDELASRATTVFVPATRAIFDLQLRWYVVAVMLLSAVLPLLAVTKLRKQYESDVTNKANLWRWIDSAVIGSLVLGGVALVSGVQDIMTLKLIVGMIFVSSALGWFAEKQISTAGKSTQNSYMLSVITGALPWLIIAGYSAGTLLYGMVRSPWYVYALYLTTLLGFVSYVLNQNKLLKTAQDYTTTERNFVQIGLFVRVAFAVILIIGLQK